MFRYTSQNKVHPVFSFSVLFLASLPLLAVKLASNDGSVLSSGFVETLGPPMWVDGVPALAEVDLNRIRLADFNGDGLTDFYRIEGWGSTVPGQILLNDGNGFYIYIQAPAMEVRGDAVLAQLDLMRVKLGDFNGDGLTDIYRIEGWNSKQASKIWLNEGNGAFRHREGPAFFISGNPVMAQVDLSRIKLGDFNGDALTDFYYVAGLGSTTPGQILLSQKNGSYHLIEAPVVSISSNAAIAKIDLDRVRLADFNGDGKIDILRINGWGPNESVPSDIWIGDGKGEWQHWDGPTIEVAGTPDMAQLDLDRIRLSDFNGDGLTDIYRIDGLGQVIPGQIWLNLTQGKYKSIPAPAVSVGATSVLAEVDLKRMRVADFNGDGLPDIYRVNGSNDLELGEIWISAGNGTYWSVDAPRMFVSGVAELAKIDLSRVHLDDFDGNGLVDIYRVNGWNSTEYGTIFLNESVGD